MSISTEVSLSRSTRRLYKLLISVPFFDLAYGAYKINTLGGLLVLSVGYIGHGIYDVGHNTLFENAGAPLWWPEFGGSADIIIGSYLLAMTVGLKTQNARSLKPE